LVGGELEAENGNLRTQDLWSSLDWLDRIGVKKGMGRGIHRLNSHKSLIWGRVVIYTRDRELVVNSLPIPMFAKQSVKISGYSGIDSQH